MFVLGSSFLSFNPRGILVLFGAASALKSNPKYPRIPHKKTEPTYMSPVKIFGSIKAKCEWF